MISSLFRTFTLSGLLLSILALAACVQVPVEGGASSASMNSNQVRYTPRADLPTASDDSEVRRRARIRLELAATYYAKGQFTTALDEVKQAESIDPRLAATHEMRALIYDALGDAGRAESAYRQALDLEPSNGSVMHNYAWFLCNQSRFAEADGLFERALRFPQSMDASRTWLARGVCQMRAGLFAEAEKSLLSAYEINTANPATAYNLASVLLRRGELDRARFYIRRVNNVQEQVTAESLWLAARIEHRLGNLEARNELGAQMRSRFPNARETTAFELGRFDD
ncbi:type IV pilus biogenesis/stability protein PilW [Aquabacterium sp. A3]|uniref:type IV pilus biogenesis/stability protein PilW n=1 Tax=Aquabacterium sp. A3 TaxID=3132829 RepID=UPI00311938E2